MKPVSLRSEAGLGSFEPVSVGAQTTRVTNREKVNLDALPLVAPDRRSRGSPLNGVPKPRFLERG